MPTCCPYLTKALCALSIVAAVAVAVTFAADEEPAATGEFTSGTIDLGVVVSDIDRSVDFYTKVVGFKEIEGFDVPASFATDVGLTNNQPFHVRVLVLNDDEKATKLKLIQFKDAPGKKIENDYINSSNGYRYLTIWVADTTAASARLKDAKIKPLSAGTTRLPEGFPQDVYLTCVKDPDGNMVELVGPKK